MGKARRQAKRDNNQLKKSKFGKAFVFLFFAFKVRMFRAPWAACCRSPIHAGILCGQERRRSRPRALPRALAFLGSLSAFCCSDRSSFWVEKTLLGGHKAHTQGPIPSPPSHRQPPRCCLPLGILHTDVQSQAPPTTRMFLHRPPSPRVCRYQSVMYTISRHTVVVASLPIQPFLPRSGPSIDARASFPSLPVPP